MCPAESVVCQACLTIASTGPHLTVDARRNRSVGVGQHNAVGAVGGGAESVFEVLGRVDVSVVGFEVYVS